MPRISVDVSQLSEKVSIVSKIVPSKTIKPILSCILFKLSNGEVFLSATDLESGIKARLRCESEGEGKFAVDAKVLNEIVRTLPDETTAEFTLSEESVTVTCGRSKFKIPTVDPSEFPDLEASAGGTEIQIDASTLASMLEKVIFCAATDEFMKNLNGVFWEVGRELLRLVASDGFRLAIAEERVISNNETSFLLSLKSMRELLSMASKNEEQTLKILYDGRCVSILANDIEMTARVVEIEFPDYKKVLPKAFKTKVVVSTDELVEALKRALVIAKRGTESIRVDVTEDILRISSRSPDYGEAQEEIDVRKDGEDILAAFNPKFLIEALRHIDSEEVELNFVDSTSPLQINPVDVSGYLYIVMPIRIV
ncbi:DNA polymerase III subunit beta [Pseudothermotoga thermarum]|uniref:Beta sliding clamp n=1 Tax=Pseudothermotoga thermarum DSM 5069 TaxID=688269 RepID=F7YYD0_9THEM|nr:DNA polymerase III subunit beta [Pseudothermotoga thermarum]AEH50951.1 DNA polymerase III, beta subunit [Pseudothermotoga thermarum DSM 5069]